MCIGILLVNNIRKGIILKVHRCWSGCAYGSGARHWHSEWVYQCNRIDIFKFKSTLWLFVPYCPTYSFFYSLLCDLFYKLSNYLQYWVLNHYSEYCGVLPRSPLCQGIHFFIYQNSMKGSHLTHSSGLALSMKKLLCPCVPLLPWIAHG